MDILLTSKTTRTDGPGVEIHCDGCKRQDAEAETYQLEEKMGVFFIPLLTQRQTFIKCRHCGAARITSLGLDQLLNKDPETLALHVRKRTSLIVWFLVIASLVLFLVPFVGLALGVIAFLCTYWHGGWPRRLSLISLCLSVIASVFFLIVMLSGKF
jgi:hypothetical protein